MQPTRIQSSHNNKDAVHHSMATCTHKIRSKLKHQNSIFYCHSALSQFSHIIFIACFSLQHFTMRFIGSHARQTCSVLLSSLCSLLTRFRRSHAFFIDSPLLSSLCSLLTRFRRSRAHHTCSVLLSSLCNLLTRVLFCSRLSVVSSHVSDALVLIIRVLFCSRLSELSSHVSEALMLSLQILSRCRLKSFQAFHPLFLSLYGPSLYLSSASPLPHTPRLSCVSQTHSQHCGAPFFLMQIYGRNHRQLSSHALQYHTLGMSFTGT